MVDLRERGRFKRVGRMSIAEILKRTLVRRIAYIVVAATLAWFGLGEARAEVGPVCKPKNVQGVWVCDQGIAYDQANVLQNFTDRCNTDYAQHPYKRAVNLAVIGPITSGDQYFYRASATCQISSNGTTWTTGQMLVFEHYYGKGCAARNAETEWINQEGGPRLATMECSGGCRWELQAPYRTSENKLISDGSTHTIYYGKIEWTGATCPTNTPDLNWKENVKPKEQECVPAGSGQTYCVKKTGENCYTLISGRMKCWRPGQTGEATDGSVLQIAKNGPTPPNGPNQPPPPGENWVQGPGTSNVTTDTVNNVMTTTNITNYSSSGGSPAGAGNTGEANTGESGNGQSGGIPGGTGDSGSDNTSVGGQNCGSAPVSSGDPLLSQIAYQAWATRCAISDRNKQQDDQAESLSNADDGLGTGDESGIFGDGMDITGQLSESLIGGGGGQCATGWNLMGKPIELPGEFWSLASWIGMLIVALAYLWAAVLLSES